MPKKHKKVRYPAPKGEQSNPLDGLTLREDPPSSGGASMPVRKDPASRSDLDCGGTTPLSDAATCRGDQSADMSAHSKNHPHRVERSDLREPTPHSALRTPHLIFSSPGIWLYHDNCLSVLDAVAEKYPEGRFDMIFADPPYFLSNGGITCHAGKMVKVDKGDWDKSKGTELNHEFNTEWLRRCQRVLRPNGTVWVTGTHHVIFSVGFAMQQLGFKILNDIAWEKPNPPPNLSCRYFTHSTETILWAAKNEKSKHLFNYAAMRAVTGKQMKTVWRKQEFVSTGANGENRENPDLKNEKNSVSSVTSCSNPDSELPSVWTMTAPGNDEKTHGKHPTQKPVALIERCLLASTNPGDLVLDPFLGGGATAIAALRTGRHCVGIELYLAHIQLAQKRVDREFVLIWLRQFRVNVRISVFGSMECDGMTSLSDAATCRGDQSADMSAHSKISKNDLALSQNLIDRSHPMADTPQIQTDRIYHETKFVFLSCAHVTAASVIHTTVDVSLQEAWAKTPSGKKRETTHIVRCETEIFRVAAKKEV